MINLSFKRHQKKKEKMEKSFFGQADQVELLIARRVQHLKMLNENKIKQPKQQTLDSKIENDDDTYVLMECFGKLSCI